MQDNSQTDDQYTPRQLSLVFVDSESLSNGNLGDKSGSEPDAKTSNVEAALDHNRYLFVDLETGGLYANKHAVLQVAAVVTDFNFNIKGQFMSYVRPHPELEVADDALRINQLNREDLEAAPEEKAVALALHHFAGLGDKPGRFAGYNCQFDLEFLAAMWQRHDLLPAPYQVPWLDIYAVAKTRLGTEAGLPNFKLASVATHFTLSTDGAHDALADLIMTIEIAKRLKAQSEQPLASRNEINLLTARFSL